jgi:hypothetical protein
MDVLFDCPKDAFSTFRTKRGPPGINPAQVVSATRHNNQPKLDKLNLLHSLLPFRGQGDLSKVRLLAL